MRPGRRGGETGMLRRGGRGGAGEGQEDENPFLAKGVA